MDNGGGAALEDIDCKIVLVGDSKCGKTALVERFVSDKFVEVYTPTGFEKYGSTYNVADYRIHFAVWDTSGSPAYDTVRPLAYQDAKVFLLCFRVSDPDSLDNAVNKWYPEIRQHCDNTPVILCGCQSDLRTDPTTVSSLAKQRRTPVSSEQAVSVSRTIGATTYVETSAKGAIKAVRDAFEVAALAALGKLNKNHALMLQQRAKGHPCKSKLDLRAELKGRAKSCCLM
ncbi:rho-related GTP-binding protein RhoE-like [Schistocerca americana]|uniref:rho-related GTP-binding protein RhoE-like n=1 Tax=Schistocerca americana TaxID=7009 RepID=UPI001F4F5B44|nr:rho-related GTP-binding protein RhoE-like [Schistocerca americana]XP_047108509.1 rho-related GTP-binding protein RhoE-like [Schistocerca piceifrons]XP_049775273.1 rho-related GTP-binding protein RhoE-like [Schistocerca cancellata]XP_049801205.1 rho-related GTP-binding protein RhoE-like [Schistocerca nitens]XP_049853537.1 rho-related GTP-binding protein RhoE-like [Schistocerca gregaria]XP_049950844.1 rho-related GTP-binding protein RhoE-like [Schistocerca serialis cubense]